MVRGGGFGQYLKGLDGKGLDKMRSRLVIWINTRQFLITRLTWETE